MSSVSIYYGVEIKSEHIKDIEIKEIFKKVSNLKKSGIKKYDMSDEVLNMSDVLGLYLDKVNSFLKNNVSQLKIVDSTDDYTNTMLVLGYELKIKSYGDIVPDNGFNIPLSKIKPFEEFKSDVKILIDYLDMSDITENMYVLNVIYSNFMFNK